LSFSSFVVFFEGRGKFYACGEEYLYAATVITCFNKSCSTIPPVYPGTVIVSIPQTLTMNTKQKSTWHLVFLVLSIIALIVTVVMVINQRNTPEYDYFNAILFITLFSVSIVANAYRYSKTLNKK